MRYPNAAAGLKLVFIGEILTIVAAVLAAIPFVGGILGIVALVLTLVGLNKAKADDQGYNTAFILSIVAIVVSVISTFTASVAVLGTLMSIADTVLKLVILYFVVTTTVKLLQSVGNQDNAKRGKTVWTINLVCTVISVVLLLLAFIPMFGWLVAGIGAIVVGIVQIVGYILYLIFLNKASKTL